MNNDDNFIRNSGDLSPELEARVVAWVLGEASAFEAAQLEMLCAERPELAVFKRRIEAVHGLLGEAAKPLETPLLLSPERRAKVLAVIGGEESVAGVPAGQKQSEPARSVKRSKILNWHSWALPMAACLTIMTLLAAVLIPTVGKVQRRAERSAELSERRMELMRSQLAARDAEDESRAGKADGYASATTVTSGLQTMDANVALPQVTTAPAPAPSAPVASNESKMVTFDLNGPVGSSEAPDRAKDSGIVYRLSAGNGAVAQPQVASAVEPHSADKRQTAVTAVTGSMAKARSQFIAGDLAAAEETIRAVQAASPENKETDAFLDRIKTEKDARAESAQTKTRAQMAGEVAHSWQRPTGHMANPAVALGDVQIVNGVRPSSSESRRDDDAPLIRKSPAPAFDEALRAEISTATEAVSTFSLHVSDASFRLAKAALERGQAPDPATVRPEEFYNAFDYGDPSPVAGEAVVCRFEQAAHPFLQQRNLVRIAMKVPATGRGAGTPLRLTVLLDTSGSMEREDRAATVRAALTGLTSLLGPDDRVTLIGFARTPRLLAESVPGDQAGKLVELAAHTPAEGGTNLEEALALAGKLAMRQKLAAAQNRIVVLTDGAANLGDADPQALARRVEALRQNGIAFDACGVVADGLDDSVLEALTRKGDGRYTILNSAEEADGAFARQLAGAFRPAAKDVKVQVRFNPARVAGYRLIGFEKHRLKTEDFRNDAVDAAELAAEEAAVALYQVEVRPDGEGELGEVSVRFLDTGSGRRVERTWTLAYAAQAPVFARATPSLQLAGASAFLAEKLRGGALAGQVRLEEFAPVVEGLAAAYPQAERVKEFITMFRQTRRLTGE